jgi:hypothetical protein
MLEMERKKDAQIRRHEERFGKLGELMTKRQKQRLRLDLTAQRALGSK